MVRHSHQDALTDGEFERLVDATDDLRPPFDREALFILIAGGRLGMRAGEICHMSREWVNLEREIIDVPAWDPCECGYCRSCATQSHRKSGVDPEEDFAERWKPKTDHAVRSIPFDFSDRVRAVILAFFEQNEEYPRSRVSINRRVDRVADAAGMRRENVYPHALRATAATFHAYRGLPPVALQSLMGWSNLAVAQKYLRLSGGATARALNDVHGD